MIAKTGGLWLYVLILLVFLAGVGIGAESPSTTAGFERAAINESDYMNESVSNEGPEYRKNIRDGVNGFLEFFVAMHRSGIIFGYVNRSWVSVKWVRFAFVGVLAIPIVIHLWQIYRFVRAILVPP